MPHPLGFSFQRVRVLTFSSAETPRLQTRISIAGTLAVGVSLGLLLFLYLREREMEVAHEPASPPAA